MRWHCHDLFNRMPPGAVAGGIAIVIDVLRASTTMITALAHGADGVLPVPTVAAAREAAGGPGGRPLLGGERGGLRIAGFDLGNSPREYTAARVAGRPIVITTTNGTAAIAACGGAAELLIGAVVNRRAVAVLARSLAAARGAADVHLVCAGTDGHVTEEDLLAAGAILDAVAATGDPGDTFDAGAGAAVAAFRAAVSSAGGPADPPAAIRAAFAASRGGRSLLALGMEADLAAAAAIDSLSCVPRLVRGGSGGGAGWLRLDAGDPG